MDFDFADSGGFHMGDFDTVKDVVNIAIACEVITRAGAFYSYKDDKWQGKERVLDALRADLSLQDELRVELMGTLSD